MIKLSEVRNAAHNRVCDIVREDDGALWYNTKQRDKSGHPIDVGIPADAAITQAWAHMTKSERDDILDKLR